MKKSLYITAFVLGFFTNFAYADVAVIVHPSNNNAVDEAMVTKIYMGREKSFVDGSSVIPVSQLETSPVTNEFNEKVLKKTGSQLKAYWSKLVFTGKGTPPKEASSDEEVLKLVSSNPNLIGFVDASKVDASVKVVLKY